MDPWQLTGNEVASQMHNIYMGVIMACYSMEILQEGLCVPHFKLHQVIKSVTGKSCLQRPPEQYEQLATNLFLSRPSDH